MKIITRITENEEKEMKSTETNVEEIYEKVDNYLEIIA